jgi:hypothetical protein
MTSETILSSLPPTVTGNGLFSVTAVVPNADGGQFEPLSANDSTSYSYPLMDPARLIGTAGQPYMNVALPAYITTLYQNTYKINDNLKNVIMSAAVDNREYPTSYAVQQYVQSQVAGTQIINGSGLVNGNGNTYTVNTTTVNTLIQAANTAAAGFSYAVGGNTYPISLYWMDVSANAPRNGASKTVMFSIPNYLKDSNGAITGNLAFLYAGNGSKFLHLGQLYSYYQFVVRGDFLDFIQSYNASTSSWEWIVKDSLGVFSDSITVASPSTISDNGGSNMPVPDTGLTLTGGGA